MLEDYYAKPSTVDRVRANWLAPQIESYLKWLEAQGTLASSSPRPGSAVPPRGFCRLCSETIRHAFGRLCNPSFSSRYRR
jgi:hypothetical protein